jgi:hypothetical protein
MLLPQPNIVNMKNENKSSNAPQTTKNEEQRKQSLRIKNSHRRASSIDDPDTRYLKHITDEESGKQINLTVKQPVNGGVKRCHNNYMDN